MTAISDDDRKWASTELERMVGAGQLTLGEFSDLSAQIWSAQTRSDLNAALVKARADNSTPQQTRHPLPTSGAVEPSPTASSALQAVDAGRMRTVFGDITRQGRWDISTGVSAQSVFGDVVLDLREAVIDSESSDVKVETFFGDIRVVVPPGVRVEVSGSRLLGDLKLDDGNYGVANGPLIRLRADSVAGDVKVRVLPVGEKIPSLWKWF